jgi:hypothetical protein
MKTRKKSKVHQINATHLSDRKNNSRRLYNKIREVKSENVVTLDEALIHFSNCNGKRELCYLEEGKKMPES